ncbi:hypothetical protein [Pseudomonas putida]|uniref:Uncharacterized protein n=1 Tax=Pseudomonas putida TaxID=303 RepID=A0A8I1EAU1_PSEPU|nr:hypothetical protein [Pseudomonas putida]MBI6883064.1 hypothetical protein [Pseudomonas putida]
MTDFRKALTARDEYFEKCLDIRVAFEKDCIAGLNGDEDFPTKACRDARDLGWDAFTMGIDREDVPALIRCDELLTGLWKDGWDCADESQSMDACHDCNDGTGNPCHVHG